MHLRRVPDYEKKQCEQNKELGLILQEHEGQAVLLSENTTKTETENEENTHGKTLLQEMDTIMVSQPKNSIFSDCQFPGFCCIQIDMCTPKLLISELKVTEHTRKS